MAKLSIVLPAFNEEAGIQYVAQTLQATLEQAGIDYELVFVDDGSKDDTYARVRELAGADARIRGLSFSRNFGKEAAIFAGLAKASGDAVVVMDADLQHPPQTILEMWKRWQDGYEVVEGIKSQRGRESAGYGLSARLFYWLMSRLMKMDMRSSSDFKLLDRKVVEALLALPERNTFFRALSFWVGFRTTTVEYQVEARAFGASKWSLGALVRYALTNVSSFSTLPLQGITLLGILTIMVSLVMGAQTLWRYARGNSVEGFTTVILLLLILGGLVMVSLGIIGHYLAKIYEEVKRRPRYIIRESTQ